jgi:Secretion system C-terminal sorting domain
MKKNFLLIIVLFSVTINAQIKILFDASKAQMAGNADWVIDADLHNLGLSSGPALLGSGTESNPQRIPTPAQSGITATTSETYWNGALSSWAIDCVKNGYVVETLPYNGQITYGVSTNVQDLSNYKVYIIDEPNINYTASEKNAIISFVQNGGGLFMISDHDVSDRNNDGIDSPSIFNELMVSNTIQPNAFGITFDLVSFSQTTTNVANLSSNPILNGSFGSVTSLKYSAGASMTLNTTQNNSVKGLIYKTGSSNTGTTNVMCASANFGNGKVVAIGDSSPPDDGTGDSGDTLYFGYSDINGNHQKLLMNATIWLATSNLANNEFELNNFNFYIAPNPIANNVLNLNYVSSESNSFSVSILDNLGRTIKIENFSNTEIGLNSKNIAIDDLKSGVYFCKINNNLASKTMRFIVH